ncbi:MAG: hypothetical protein ACI9JN_000620 [Bacteroidia bacterium]|jgi:hypothetical protein
MGLIYKVVISLVALLHIVGFAMGVFMPGAALGNFGIEYADNLVPIATHFGILMGIFGCYLGLAAFWAFKEKAEGFVLGILGGLCMSVAFIIDRIMIGGETDYILLAMGILTAVTAYLAQKAHKNASGTSA